MEENKGLIWKIKGSIDSYMQGKVEKKLYSGSIKFTRSEIPYLKQMFDTGLIPPEAMITIVQKLNDKNLIMHCIESPNVNISDYDKAVLIKYLGDSEYTKKCIENPNLWENQELKEYSPQIGLIRTLGDDYTKKYIEDPDSNISALGKEQLILRIGKKEYTKQCIQRAEELGITSDVKTTLILETMEEEFIEQQFIPKSIDTKIDVPKGMTIGIEIEAENSSITTAHGFRGWRSEGDTTLENRNRADFTSYDRK